MSQGVENGIQSPADEEAGALEMTDEQIWDELEAEENGGTKPEDEDDVPAPEPDEVTGQENDGTDDDPDPSKDDDETPGGAEEPEGSAEPDKEDPDAKIARLEHALKSERGRVAGLTRKLERSRKSSETGNAPSQDDDEARGTRKEKLDEAREEYGDILNPVIEEVEGLQSTIDSLKSDKALREQDDAEALAAELKEQEDVFLKEHPDGLDVVKEHAEVFSDWIEDQPKRLRDIFASNREAIVDGHGAALLVETFKQSLAKATEPDPETEKLEKKRQRQLDGARTSRPGGRQAVVPDIDPDVEDPQAHWDYWEKKDREQQRGRNR